MLGLSKHIKEAKPLQWFADTGIHMTAFQKSHAHTAVGAGFYITLRPNVDALAATLIVHSYIGTMQVQSDNGRLYATGPKFI